MAGTAWNTLVRPDPRSWLLGNGEIVYEPTVEQSPGGRRVRIAGTTKSWSNYSLDDLLQEAVEALAKQKRTRVWIETTKSLDFCFSSFGKLDVANLPADLHLLNPAVGKTETLAWWKFKDSHTPYHVLVTARLIQQRAAVGTPHVLHVQVHAPINSTAAYDQTPDIKVSETDGFRTMLDNLRSDEERSPWIEFIRDNPVEWASVLGTTALSNAREGVLALLNAVREIEEFESVEVPDLGQNKPAYRTLELYETNVNGAFINDLSEYLDGLPVVEVAAQHYASMLAALKTAGVHVEGKDENDFMAALLAGDKVVLSMNVLRPANDEGPQSVDPDHKVSVHIPTGTFIVECSHKQTEPDRVAEAWNEALVIAQLSGEEPALLAYAREYARTAHKKRTREILKERGARK